MRIIGERADGTLAVRIAPDQLVLYSQATGRVSKPMDTKEVSLDDFADTDNSPERRHRLRRAMDRADLGQF